MVSLESRTNYLRVITENPKLTAFNNLLYNKEISFPNDDPLKESDEIFFGLITAIQSNNKDSFENYYKKRSRSTPSKGSPSPFINDDFLIFTLIIGIIKYGLNKEWINNILSIRSINPITTTFNNILKADYYSRGNLHEIILIFAYFCEPSIINNDLLNICHQTLSNNPSLFQPRNDFQTLCAMRSYDLIIELKDAPDGSIINQLQLFNTSFLRRIKFLTWILQTSIIIFILYYIIIVNILPWLNIFINKNINIIGFIGISVLSVLSGLLPPIKRFSYISLLRLFGYPKALTKKL